MKDLKCNEIYQKAVNLPIGVKNGIFYIYTDGYWKRIEDRDLMLKIMELYPESTQALISDTVLKDTLNRLRNTPRLQLIFTEENQQNLLNLKNGVFDADAGTLITKNEEHKFSYILDFEYQEKVMLEKAITFKKFVESVFPEDTEKKTELLLQITGYCISDYLKAKAGFFFLGASNSGKSTLLELTKKVLPEKTVTAIPLHRLTNRFNIARLDGMRLNVCSEIDEKSFAALDLFKQLTSNETVTAEHKGQAPFEFRLKCKSLNAGNALPKFEALEGMDAILNRLIILYFPVSIPKEKQELQMVEKLWDERNLIFSMALDALVRLKENNFIFEEPEDTARMKAQIRAESQVFGEFLNDCCERGKDAKVHIAELYRAFTIYCEQNLIEAKFTKTQFTQKLYREQGIKRSKFRINGGRPLWGAEGIKLKYEFA